MCEGMKGFRRKVSTRTKILSPNICYFVAISRFVSIYALFGRLWAKKVQKMTCDDMMTQGGGGLMTKYPLFTKMLAKPMVLNTFQGSYQTET